MRRLFSVIACVVLCGATVARAQAQDQEPVAAFQAAVGDYQDNMRAIEKLWAEYQTADEGRQTVINEELKPLVASAKTKVNAMVDAAIESYKADPNGDQQVTDLLLEVAEFRVVGKGEQGGGDQFESALPVIEALIDGGHEKAELPVWGVLAAICANEFDLADKFAKIARDTGALAAPPQDEGAAEVHGQAVRYLSEIDRYRARWEKEKAIREKEAIADNNPRVKFSLTKGDIVIELFEDQAPIATANIITLVKKGYYDGLIFHRVLPHFMAQGGDPTGTGSGGPGYSIACECYEPDAREHFRGSLSMAHAGRDTGGSQFFLCFVPTDFLDGSTPGSHHTVFGRVVEGIDVIGDIQIIDPDKRGPKPDQIIKAEVLRDRGHAYDFEKLPGR